VFNYSLFLKTNKENLLKIVTEFFEKFQASVISDESGSRLLNAVYHLLAEDPSLQATAKSSHVMKILSNFVQQKNNNNLFEVFINKIKTLKL
jgi:hypothetical protein